MHLTSKDVRGSSALVTVAGMVAILIGILGMQIAERMKQSKARHHLNESFDEAIQKS